MAATIRETELSVLHYAHLLRSDLWLVNVWQWAVDMWANRGLPLKWLRPTHLSVQSGVCEMLPESKRLPMICNETIPTDTDKQRF